MTDQTPTPTAAPVWAIVELFGHAQAAGRISKPSDWGGLIQIDIPTGPDSFRTEFIGPAAIYRLRIVGEPIARGYATETRVISAYDAPVVTREEHQSVVRELQEEITALGRRLRAAQQQLAAPAAAAAENEYGEGPEEDEADGAEPDPRELEDDDYGG